jgi:hypothetical protein
MVGSTGVEMKIVLASNLLYDISTRPADIIQHQSTSKFIGSTFMGRHRKNAG